MIFEKPPLIFNRQHKINYDLLLIKKINLKIAKLLKDRDLLLDDIRFNKQKILEENIKKSARLTKNVTNKKNR